MRTRRAALRLGAAMFAALALPRAGMAAGGATLTRPASLAAEIERAVAGGKALVVMVSLEVCPYCKLVRESYLAPLRAAGQPVVEIEMARSLPLVDAQGRASTHEQVVRALGVRVAPTVLFLGRRGAEAAPRITGMPLPDFYGAYLQERVEAGNRAVSG